MAISSTVIVAPAAASTVSTGAAIVTAQAESSLSAEVNLGALSTGLLKHSVSGGVSTPATAVSGTDYAPATGGALTLIETKGAGGGIGSAVTSWSFGSLSDAAYRGRYKITSTIFNNSGSNADFTMTVNAGTALTYQRHSASGTSTAATTATLFYTTIANGTYGMIEVEFWARKTSAGFTRLAMVYMGVTAPAEVLTLSTAALTTTEVTSIELVSSVANGIGIGSEASIYYLRGA